MLIFFLNILGLKLMTPIAGAAGVYLEGVLVPHTVERGDNAVLECNYRALQHDSLYR